MTAPVAPVFVVGPPRSGTTLLRVMLCRHPDCWILTETHLFDLWVPRYPGLQDGDAAAFEAYWQAFTATEPFTWLELDAGAVADRVRRGGRHRAADVLAAMLAETSAARGARVVGEKTPDHAHHVGELFAAFPGARILWMLRDPAATVASELALDRPWASDDVAVAATRWTAGTRAHLAWRADPRVLAVRFEDLVAAPDPVLRRVCDHVGLGVDAAMLADEGGHDAYRHGRHDPWGRLDRDAAAGPPALSVRQVEIIDAIAGATARAVGYPSPRRLARGGIATVAAARLVRHVRRLATTVSRSAP